MSLIWSSRGVLVLRLGRGSVGTLVFQSPTRTRISVSARPWVSSDMLALRREGIPRILRLVWSGHRVLILRLGRGIVRILVSQRPHGTRMPISALLWVSDMLPLRSYDGPGILLLRLTRERGGIMATQSVWSKGVPIFRRILC